VDFNAYLTDIPLLHHWGGEWRRGGFDAGFLTAIHDTIAEHTRHPRIIETGAGNTTITFLHLDPARVVSIAPDEALRDRITAYCDEHGIPTGALDYRPRRSETELPLVAAEDETFDVAFIDGEHGWPTAFVDFCYMNMVVRRGGLIFVDDIQLHSVAELSRLLAEQPGYELVEEIGGKVQVWRKDLERRFLPGHSQQPYIMASTG
jgi:predicted O-methyltransferase YrrM